MRFNRFRAWYYRRKVGSAADDVKGWKWLFWFWNFVSAMMLGGSLGNLIIQRFLTSLIGLIFACGLFVWGLKIYGVFGKLSLDGRVKLAAKRNKVKPQEVIAALQKVK